MSASSSNRETARDALAGLLTTALATAAQKVYGYREGNFGTEMPVVMVQSAGSERYTDEVAQPNWHTWFYFNILVFIVYSDPESSWTEANAADAQDLIEKTVADTLMNNYSYAPWLQVEYAGRSVADDVQEEGGASYVYELIPIRVLVLGS